MMEEWARPQATHAGALLMSVEWFLTRYVVFGSIHQITAISLWVLHTHALDAAEATPYLGITSAEKRSGKSRLLEVLELLVARPWRTFRPSESVLFRKIAKDQPTLLLDEVDAIFKDKGGTYEGHRALLNAGHRRGATVARCQGDGAKITLQEFPVFCAKALAGIGELPDTVADRCIPIRLHPRKQGVEQVERFRARDAEEIGSPIRRSIIRWAEEHTGDLCGARPEIPSSTSDRAADGWEPLLAIADLAGGEWPQRARDAAVALHGDPFAQEDTIGVALLRAIQDTFDNNGTDRITTADLLSALVERDDGPWAEFWGKAVAAGDTRGPGARVAHLLRKYGISPKTIRLDDGRTPKGYSLVDFEDVFSRFLPSIAKNNATTLDNQGLEGQNGDATAPLMLRSLNALGEASSTVCGVVASLNGQEGGEGKTEPPEDPLVAYARGVFGGDVVEVRRPT